ncbi:hypothetical protein DEU56DRAFT_757806 [Suillus clintonianus]|uniref:uncharacterized protein n=1 Tax=Suillus clintonianus TaxID=1904413 RepID=UPI001B883EF0|nr:uncharacterized protein DEU56DRAFT_757806 [Suillus clintonianus]KAG2130735.1 hypothetical protein DEU56DRAFT_757806 [Suillus clintonianus]
MCEHIPRPMKEELDGGLAADAPSAKVARYQASNPTAVSSISAASPSVPSTTAKRTQPSVEQVSKKARLDNQPSSFEVDENESSDAGDSYEDSDAWLDGSVNLVDEDDPGYLRCSNREFVSSEDARLDGPELLDLLSDKPIETAEAEDQSQTPGPSSQTAGGGPIAWKFNFSQIL